MSQTQPTQQTTNRPEKKFGPYPGGVSVAVWLNQFQTDDGPRTIRSVTISPRRYRDNKTGEWKDAPSYRPGDLPALIFALQKALEHTYLVPLPSATEEGDGEEPF